MLSGRHRLIKMYWELPKKIINKMGFEISSLTASTCVFTIKVSQVSIMGYMETHIYLGVVTSRIYL